MRGKNNEIASSLDIFNLNPVHGGLDKPVIGTYVLGHSLAPLTHSLAPHCSLRSRAPLRSFVRSLARSLTHSGAHGKETYVFELNALISYCFNPLCDDVEEMK